MRSPRLRVFGANVNFQFGFAASHLFQEVVADFLISALVQFIMEPRVLLYLLKCRTICRVVAEDCLHQILKFGWDVRCFKSGPVRLVDAISISHARLEEVKELVIHLSFAEGEVADDDREQDDT